tara:strand:- start:229 stop:1725 length:1497 start_codon:yes stop_codon:yes gene_type:complete
MKLLRLTTRETNGLYDCSFNDQLVIPPNSKIALQSLSMDLDPLSLSITGQNNALFYQITGDYSKTVLLNPFDYNSANYKVLLTDIENKLNDSLVYDPTKTKKILGMEWIALINAQKHVSIAYDIGAMSEFAIQDQNGFGWRNNDDNLERSVAVYGVWSLKDGAPATPLFDNNLIMNGFISRGNGFLRTKIDRLDTDSDGYYMGLVQDDSVINTGNIALNDMTYAIRVYTVGGVRTYATVIDGVETDSVQPVGFIGNGDNNNDIQEIQIDGDTVKFNVYTQAGGATPVNLHGGRLDYTSGQTLFPFLIINGDKDSTRVARLRLTLSPYNPSIAEYIKTEYEPDSELGVSPPLPSPILLSLNLIEWGSYGVARFLGYTTQRQPQTGYIQAAYPTFNGERVFNIPSEADSYLIEMMNLSCDSYDSYSNTEFAQGGQRKNLLSVIPSTNESGKLVYFPPYPTFVDLLNREEIYLRNIKIRVSRTDYSEVSASGLGSMVLLIN